MLNTPDREGDLSKIYYAKHRHLCDQMWMKLFQSEVSERIDPPERDLPNLLEELNEAVRTEDPTDMRDKTDDDLLFIMQLAKMAVYELTVHGAGVLTFRQQRPTTDKGDNRIDTDNSE